MGFRNLEEFNISLLAKQAWNLIHNPSSLWARILQQQYYPNSTFLQAKKGAASSWVWASLLAGREIIQKGSLWSIGNGFSTNMSREIGYQRTLHQKLPFLQVLTIPKSQILLIGTLRPGTFSN